MSRRNYILLTLSLIAASVFLTAQTPAPAQEPRSAQKLVSYAGAMHPMDLPKQVDQSAAIVVGEVSRLLDSPGEYFRDIHDDEPSKAMFYAAEVNVREVLKGPIHPGKLVVGGLLPIPPGRKAPLTANTVRIFFLVRQQDSWRFVDPFFGVLIAAPEMPRTVPGSVMENVLQQMFAALSSDSLSPEEKRKVVSQFGGIQDPRVVPALHVELDKSKDDMLTASILGSLIIRNDSEGLARARTMIAMSKSPAVGMLLMSMARLNRVELLPEIVAGLQSPTHAVRGMAVLALAESQMPEADAPLLATLESPDRRLVTQLMISLAARFKKPDWAPYWDDDPKWDDMLQQWRRFRDDHSAGNGQ